MTDWTGTVTITGNQCLVINDRACQLGLTLHGVLVQEPADGLLIEVKDYSVEIVAKGYIAVYETYGNTVAHIRWLMGPFVMIDSRLPEGKSLVLTLQGSHFPETGEEVLL